jgi:hypothetical protein
VAKGEHATTNTVVDVVVNLEYARPETLFAGMAEERLRAALSLAGARPVPSPVAEGTNAASKLRFLLPDGQGLEVGIYRPEYRLAAIPVSPTVSELTVGEAGRGFEAWDRQKTQTVTGVNVSQYRQGKR